MDIQEQVARRRAELAEKSLEEKARQIAIRRQDAEDSLEVRLEALPTVDVIGLSPERKRKLAFTQARTLWSPPEKIALYSIGVVGAMLFFWHGIGIIVLIAVAWWAKTVDERYIPLVYRKQPELKPVESVPLQQ